MTFDYHAYIAEAARVYVARRERERSDDALEYRQARTEAYRKLLRAIRSEEYGTDPREDS